MVEEYKKILGLLRTISLYLTYAQTTTCMHYTAVLSTKYPSIFSIFSRSALQFAINFCCVNNTHTSGHSFDTLRSLPPAGPASGGCLTHPERCKSWSCQSSGQHQQRQQPNLMAHTSTQIHFSFIKGGLRWVWTRRSLHKGRRGVGKGKGRSEKLLQLSRLLKSECRRIHRRV